MKIIVDINPIDIGKLEIIGRNGNASNGYSQDFNFCLRKAIEEFIKKYETKKT